MLQQIGAQEKGQGFVQGIDCGKEFALFEPRVDSCKLLLDLDERSVAHDVLPGMSGLRNCLLVARNL
jgi:hypothetical protein